MRRARADRNQPELVEAYRRLGASVQHLHTVGRGCPELLVGIHGLNVLVEAKTSLGKMTPDELDWHLSWTGQVEIVRSVDEAVERWQYWRKVADLLAELTGNL